MNTESNIKSALETILGRKISQATEQDLYYALLTYVKVKASSIQNKKAQKKVYYISSEFLIGKMLISNLINMGIYDEVTSLLKNNGVNITDIAELEPEPSLGNGGLGRLAACFLDSIASLAIPATGISLNYHNGLFKQKFEKNCQIENPNPWIEKKRLVV